MYHTYNELGNYKLALRYRDTQVLYKESILNEQKLEVISQIETNYEIKIRDNEIVLLSKENELIELKAQKDERIKYLFLVIVVLLIINSRAGHWIQSILF